MENLSELYKNFILNDLHTLETWDQEKLEVLYSLHNIYVNPSQPSQNRHCKSCIQKTIDAVRAFYPL